MATATQKPTSHRSAPSSVLALLDRLRSRIRWYVIAEGVAMLLIFVVIAFWLGFAIDYLPVLLGANEMPREARLTLLILTALVLCWVLYHYIFRRIFHAFRNSSLALLIERHFPSFRDSLVTTVEIEEADSSLLDDADRRAIAEVTANSTTKSKLGIQMLSQTIDRATAGVADVRLGKIFSFRPLLTKLLMAAIAVGSLVFLGVVNREALGTAASRLLLFSDQAWERRALIELVGFDENGVKKVAKGTDLIMRVRADANRDFPPPELCSILYETADGDRGRVNMSRDGEPTDGYQYYVFNGKPFKSILDDIYFDVIGGDYRLRDKRVHVVLSPVVTTVRLKSELPSYTRLLPKDEKWTPGAQLPIGSKVAATIQASKQLVAAKIKDIDTGEELELDFSPSESADSHSTSSSNATSFTHEIDRLRGRVALAITLKDTDGIESLEPFLLAIGAVEDEIPIVDMALRGIGNAITANARLRVEGKISDDYEVARNWFQLQLGDKSREFDFPIHAGDFNSTALDLREESTAEQETPLVLKPQDRLVFSVRASDKFDLDGQSHIGSNEPTTLTVVRPDELLAILDGRELGLRRRFEQIRSEMLQSRDSLARLRSSFAEVESSGDEAEQGIATRNLADLRDRWASWAQQKSDQMVLEIDGVALAFEDVHEELTNNRVDTPERKSRLQDQIIAPLRSIAQESFPTFQQSLRSLRTAMSTTESTSEQQSIAVLENADNILVAMDAVLEKMLELEDYAEIINVVRQIIEQQENLLEQTKEQQKASLLELLQ